MTDFGRTTAIVPAYNEEDRIEATVRALSRVGVGRIVVVNDGSDDLTEQVARRCGAEVITLPTRSGKGRALSAGLSAVEDAEAVVLVDADVRDSATEVSKLLLPVLSGEIDMAIGVLPVGLSGGWGIAQAVARLGLIALTGKRLKAPLSGQRAIRRSSVSDLLPLGRGFGAEVSMTVNAARAGLRLREIDVAMTHRTLGKSTRGLVHRAVQLVHIVRALAVSGMRGR